MSITKTDVIKRHQLYAENLETAESPEPIQLLVITRGRVEGNFLGRNFKVVQFKCSRYNLLKFIRKSKRFLDDNRIDVGVIVSSDPWETFLVIRLIRLFISREIPLQVQVHADISDSRMKSNLIRHLINRLIQMIAFKSATQIRVVSKEIENYLISKYGIPNSRIVVIPVPLNPNFFIKPRIKNKIPRIGFFGRLHKERGTDLLPDYLLRLKEANLNFELVIAGEGPEESILLQKVGELLEPRKIEFHGWLNHLQLSDLLGTLDVYVSLAPSESYGLGMREAVATGVPVIAVNSKGALSLSGEVQSPHFQVISLSLNKSEVVDSFLAATNMDKSEVEANLNFMKSESQIADIAESWIDLINASAANSKT